MPRLARAIFPGVPHHITQRGNRREDVFHTEEDREVYLEWLRTYTEQNDVQVLAYCLMTNHIHIVAIPKREDGIHRALKPLHMRYAQRVNKVQGWKGHVWQGRYFSAPLDEAYTWAAVRYVERNPVRAELVKRAEEYRWSSAAAHCGLIKDPVLAVKGVWARRFNDLADWSRWLQEADDPEKLMLLRRNIDKGLPCGTERFVKRLSKKIGRSLEYRPRGRPQKMDSIG